MSAGPRRKSAYLETMRMFLDRYGFLEETWFTFSFSPITDESGGVGGVFHPVTEMTTQMLSERRTQITRDLASRTGRAHTFEEASARSMEVLAQAALDLPFVMLYVIDRTSGRARLLGQTGVQPATSGCRDLVEMESADDSHWAIGEVARNGVATQLDDVGARLAGARVGPYPEQPKSALVLPIMLPGSDAPASVMVAGVSARLALNGSYRAFYDQVTAVVATSLATHW